MSKGLQNCCPFITKMHMEKIMKITINIAAFLLGLVAVKFFGVAGFLIVLVAWACVELYYYSQRTP